jgi:hypothetical protein
MINFIFYMLSHNEKEKSYKVGNYMGIFKWMQTMKGVLTLSYGF